jgi:hypothetical protein
VEEESHRKETETKLDSREKTLKGEGKVEERKQEQRHTREEPERKARGKGRRDTEGK